MVNQLQVGSIYILFFIMGQSRPLFVYFRYFLDTISIIEKSVDGVLGIRTRGRRMVGADETTELWRPPNIYTLFTKWRSLLDKGCSLASGQILFLISCFLKKRRWCAWDSNLGHNTDESTELQWPLLISCYQSVSSAMVLHLAFSQRTLRQFL